MSALKTLAYFDQFDYPLTALECWRYAIDSDAREKRYIQNDLDMLLAKGKIIQLNGYIALAGRESIIDIRGDRTRLAEQKYRKALRFVSFLRWFPFVRMIGICNTLSLSHSREDADIDFFIITAPHRVWTVRLLTTVFAHLLGQRPDQHHMRDSFCLSFFVAEDSMNLRRVALGDDDIYFANWVQHLVPVFDTGNVYQSFWGENQWITSLLPNAFQKIPAERRLLVDRWPIRFMRLFFEFVFWLIGPMFERFVCRLQWKGFPAKIRVLANLDTRVVVTGDMLKFHDADRREEYRRQWKERYEQVRLREPSL